jgi:vacuolar protein sorting-associated protein 29
LPKVFKDMLIPGKISLVLCAGNLCNRETYEWLRTISSDLHVVMGDLDETADYPTSKTVVIGGFKVRRSGVFVLFYFAFVDTDFS